MLSESHQATFLYSDDCPVCEPTLRNLLLEFDARGARLYVRKPTPAELNVPNFGFPALVLPVGFCGLTKVHVLTGSGIVEAMRRIWDTAD